MYLLQICRHRSLATTVLCKYTNQQFRNIFRPHPLPSRERVVIVLDKMMLTWEMHCREWSRTDYVPPQT